MDDDDYYQLDTSNITFINTLWLVREPDFIIEKVALFLPLVVLGIAGNTQVIYIITKNVHLQTPTNLLIANMAVADLLSLLFHPWVFITYDVFQNYQLGLIGCYGEGALECITILLIN
ncbi:unnamed protein product [Brassicogethes aeneus]|uniref:G-protein coupled receptors family 1 profile domain-containing protein n=1 Tax=Brassicogethes aeneus TaxID=1431903 RepID=A0A9P0FRB9_BRAAE|nr:unnamed protein product [Brassicogethes aeneus]